MAFILAAEDEKYDDSTNLGDLEQIENMSVSLSRMLDQGGFECPRSKTIHCWLTCFVYVLKQKYIFSAVYFYLSILILSCSFCRPHIRGNVTQEW